MSPSSSAGIFSASVGVRPAVLVQASAALAHKASMYSARKTRWD